MQKIIELYPIESLEPFDLEVTEPGHLRHILVRYQDPEVLIPLIRDAPVTAAMRPIPVLVFEADPSAAKRLRHFVWLPANTPLTFAGQLEYCGVFMAETLDTPLVLFEAT